MTGSTPQHASLNLLHSATIENVFEVSKLLNIDKNLVFAIIMIESGGETFAIRYEPHYRWITKDYEEQARRAVSSVETEVNAQKTSWGLMQVMGSVYRELGGEGFISRMVTPQIGIMYGCRKFRELLDRYSNVQDAIAAYNAGSPRRNEDGKYVNQAYVDKVLKKVQEFEASESNRRG